MSWSVELTESAGLWSSLQKGGAFVELSGGETDRRDKGKQWRRGWMTATMKSQMGGGRAGSSQAAFEAGSWRDNRGGFTPETQRSDATMGVTLRAGRSTARTKAGQAASVWWRRFIVSAEHLCAILRDDPTAECKEGAGDKWASKHGHCLNKPPV